MSRLEIDRYGQDCPYFYRVDIVRDAESSYVANLGDTFVLTGFFTNNTDVLFSRYLALAKASLLEDDPRLTENGNGYVQVYLVDGIKCEQYLIYDSNQTYLDCRGLSREIIGNFRNEIDLLWCYFRKPSMEIGVIEDDGEIHQCIISNWFQNDVKPSFLEPLSTESWEMIVGDFDRSHRLKVDSNRETKYGLFRTYGTYSVEQVESEDAA